MKKNDINIGVTLSSLYDFESELFSNKHRKQNLDGWVSQKLLLSYFDPDSKDQNKIFIA